MAEAKARPTSIRVEDFLAALEDPVRRTDGEAIVAIMGQVTGEAPRMWGPSIIGFGSYDYTYDSGHSGTSCRIGFSPRKAELVLYVLTGTEEQAGQLARLGKHRRGKGCLYIKRLADVDQGVLHEIIALSLAENERRHPR